MWGAPRSCPLPCGSACACGMRAEPMMTQSQLRTAPQPDGQPRSAAMSQPRAPASCPCVAQSCVGAVTVAAPQVGRERPPHVHEAASRPEVRGLELGGALLKRAALSGRNRLGRGWSWVGPASSLPAPDPQDSPLVPPPPAVPASHRGLPHGPPASGCRAHVSARMTFPLDVPLHPT